MDSGFKIGGTAYKSDVEACTAACTAANAADATIVLNICKEQCPSYLATEDKYTAKAGIAATEITKIVDESSSAKFTCDGGIEAGVGVVDGDSTYSVLIPFNAKVAFKSFDLSLNTVTIAISKDPAAIDGEMGIFSKAVDTSYQDPVGMFYSGIIKATIPIVTKKELPADLKGKKDDVEGLYNIVKNDKDYSPDQRNYALTQLQTIWPAFRTLAIKESLALKLGKAATDITPAQVATAFTAYKDAFSAQPDGLLIENISSSGEIAGRAATANEEYDFMFKHPDGPMAKITGSIDKQYSDSYFKAIIGQMKGAWKPDLNDMTYNGGFAPIQLGTHGFNAAVEYKQRYADWVALMANALVAFKTGAVFFYGSTDKENPHYSNQKGAYLAIKTRLDFHIVDWFDVGLSIIYQTGLSGKQALKDDTYGLSISPLFTINAGKVDYDKKKGEFFQPTVTINPEFWIQNGGGFFVGGKIAWQPYPAWLLEAGGGYANHPGEEKTLPGNTEKSGNCKVENGVPKCFDDVTPSGTELGPDDVDYQQASLNSVLFLSGAYTPWPWLTLKLTVADEAASQYVEGGGSNAPNNLRVMFDLITSFK